MRKSIYERGRRLAIAVTLGVVSSWSVFAAEPCAFTATTPPVLWTMDPATGELKGTRQGYVHILDSDGVKQAKSDGSVNFTEDQSSKTLMMKKFLANGCYRPAEGTTPPPVVVVPAVEVQFLANPTTYGVGINGQPHRPSNYSVCKDLSAAAKWNSYWWCPTAIGSLTEAEVSALTADGKVKVTAAPAVDQFLVLFGDRIDASGQLINAQPLAGASTTLKQFTVQIFPPAGKTVTQIRAYCCKVREAGSETGAVIAEHAVNTVMTSAPYTWVVSLSDSYSKPRELWFAAKIGTAETAVFTFFNTVYPAEGPIGDGTIPTGPHPVQFSWTPPNTREDGTALAITEIAGYQLLIVTAVGNNTRVVQLPAASRSVTQNFPAGDYYGAIAAIDTNGLVSKNSTAIPFKTPL